MKKILLSLFVLAGIAFSGKVRAQCSVSDFAVQVISFNTSTCQVTFNISFEQEVNSGNKFAYIHLWTNTGYHTPALAWPGGGSAIYNGPNDFPEAAQLVNALATIAVEFNGSASPTIGSVYYPDDPAVIPTSAGLSIVKTILPGGLRERETISGLTITLPSCAGVVSFKGDIWASQAANGKNVHCAVQGFSFSVNNPAITTMFKVCNPRSISFGIKNNDVVPLTEHFVLWKDDGDGVFEPFSGLGGDGPSIFTSADTVLLPGAVQSRTQFAYPGSTTPGEGASIWLQVVVPSTGYTVIAFASNNAQGCLLLPVEFKSFTAARNRSNVDINWVTVSEFNNTGFYIERALGNDNWETIAFELTLARNGISEKELYYSYTDPNDFKGISQYRLRQVDIDGRIKYSDIRIVRGEDQKDKVTVFPNPSDGKVSVLFGDNNNIIRNVTLVDMSGRIIKEWKGITVNSIQIEHLTAGMYALRIFVPATGNQTVEKLIVSKR